MHIRLTGDTTEIEAIVQLLAHHLDIGTDSGVRPLFHAHAERELTGAVRVEEVDPAERERDEYLAEAKRLRAEIESWMTSADTAGLAIQDISRQRGAAQDRARTAEAERDALLADLRLAESRAESDRRAIINANTDAEETAAQRDAAIRQRDRLASLFEQLHAAVLKLNFDAADCAPPQDQEGWHRLAGEILTRDAETYAQYWAQTGVAPTAPCPTEPDALRA